MALLTGSLYTKKTFGKSLFGDLVQSATESADVGGSKADTSNKKGPEIKAESKEDHPVDNTKQAVENQMPTDPTTASNSAEVKVTWTKTQTGKTKRPPKEFFTPKEETEPEVEHEKDVLNIDPLEKKAKKRLPVTNQPTTLRLPKLSITTPKPQPLGKQTGTKPVQKQSKETPVSTKETKTAEPKQPQQSEEQPALKKVQEVENESEISDAGTSHDENTDDEEPRKQILETVFEEATEDLSDDSSSENKSETAQRAYSKKPIVIKVVQPTKYAEKLRALLAEEGQAPSLEVLQPDAIANLKRELARKGIIESYDDDDFIEQPITDDADTTESDPTKEISEFSGDLPESTDLQTTNDTDSVKDDAALKDDKRDGYKTNKSFEIRRLQAKAEREREEKRNSFLMPKAGSKVTSFPESNDHNDGTAVNYKDHRKNWVRKKPKSILKMGTKDNEVRVRSKNKTEKRKSATVRIREPEYDYRLFSASESDDSSELPLSQSSSVLGYRPNSATSLSLSDSTISFVDDASFDSVYYSRTMQDLQKDEEFSYSVSAQGRRIHDLYDDIDRLNPSRLTNVRTPYDTQDRPFSSRVASADHSFVERSSLHALNEFKNNQRPIRNTSAVLAYDDKPLQLFDAMRYENDRRRTHRGNIRGNQSKHPDVTEEATPPPSRELTESGKIVQMHSQFQSRKTPSGKQKVNGKAIFPDGAIAFGSHMVPIPGKVNDIPAEISETEWVDRAQKFFATAYAGRRKQAEQRKSLKKPGIANTIFQKLKRPKKTKLAKNQLTKEEIIIMPAICFCESCPNCCSFACSTESAWTSAVVIFLPTIIIVTCLLLAIFWVTGIFSV